MNNNEFIQEFGIDYLQVSAITSCFLKDDGEIESIDGYVESMNGRTATGFVLHYEHI
jgi:hypothetical protein